LALALRGTVALETVEYVTLLLPTAFLSLGAGLFAPFENASPRVFLGCLLSIVLAAALPLSPLVSGPNPWPPAERTAGVLVLLALGALSFVFLLPSRAGGFLGLGLLFTAYLAAFPDLPANMSVS